MEVAKPNCVRFGEFTFDLRAGELRNGKRRIVLQEQPYQILLMLVNRRGDVVTRDEIQKRLWPNDTIVEFDHSIHTAIKKLRQALGDSADNPKYVETVARRGYRLIMPVEPCAQSPQNPAPVTVEEIGTSDEPAANEAESGPGGSLIGKKISHYRVLGVLGGGGMGLVYRAEDLKLGRGVALKFLPEDLVGEPGALARFEREARAASALDHPNICAVHEFGEYEGHSFIAMQLLEGQTLRDRIAAVPLHGFPFATAELLSLAAQIADGLAAAHHQGIIHRDIKPANVFITKNGVAKILDFGLAKRTSNDAKLEAENVEPTPIAPSHPFDSTHPTLTRTGVALGTAAYMSPEQVRGEPLDARSDLFSFGLVLYEMATGRQAFSGDTVEAMNDAILNRSPAPVRQINPEISPRLESVISKALEKDRSKRCQSAVEMHAEFVNQQEKRKRKSVAWALTGALVIGLMAFGFYWAALRRIPAHSELRETRITTNANDSPVHTGAISPDGKYLAYSDQQGVHLKLFATGETQTLSREPSEGYFAWFPDSSRFLMSQSWAPGISLFSVLGGPVKSFRADGYIGAVSPDGSLVSFTTNKGRLGDREIWLIRADGTNPRMFLSVGDDSSLQEPLWSPDGTRVIYVVYRQTAENLEVKIESRDMLGGPPVVAYSETAPDMGNTGVQDFVWLSDGRMIFSLRTPKLDLASFPSPGENLWELRVDAGTGQPKGPMRRITSWFEPDIVALLYPTADGKKLSVLKVVFSVSVYLADFDVNKKTISTPTRLTATDGLNVAPTWTADSQTILFESHRDSYHIFSQQISQDISQPVALGPGDASVPVLSPDGAFLIYVTPRHAMVGGSSATVQLMSVPIKGGSSQLLLTARIYDSPRCSRAPAKLCAIAEPSLDRKQIIFTSFDPMQGRGRELIRADVDPNADYAWDLSPDGTRIAFLKRVPRPDGVIVWAEGLIHLLSLTGEPAPVLRTKGVEWWSEYLDWAADGKGFILTDVSKSPKELVYADLQGSRTALGHFPGVAPYRAVQSPDGRHLAILSRSQSSNLWLLENF